MKQYLDRYLKPAYLPVAALAGGLLAMVMRLWLFGLGTDERGLLPAATFPDIFSWILAALMLALLFWCTRRLNEATKYSFNFRPSMPAAGGTLLGALGILITCLIELISGGERLGIFSSVMGLLAAAVLIFLAYCRWTGMKPMFLLHSFVCLWLMFHLVSHYRLWSAYPQLQTYAFELLAIIFLMLSCYQRAAFDAGNGKRKAYALFTYAAVFFCAAAIPGSATPVFYIGSALWMFATPCNLKPLAASKKHEQ